jgi:hypothetical protein
LKNDRVHSVKAWNISNTILYYFMLILLFSFVQLALFCTI